MRDGIRCQGHFPQVHHGRAGLAGRVDIQVIATSARERDLAQRLRHELLEAARHRHGELERLIRHAELDAAELWNRATLGVVSISNSRDYLDGLIKNVERAATRIANNHGAEIADSFVEYF